MCTASRITFTGAFKLHILNGYNLLEGAQKMWFYAITYVLMNRK